MVTSGPRRPPRSNLGQRAYDLCEALIVRCALPPGRFLLMQTLQDATGLGRTPVHQAVNRLAADTLILVRPRHGLQVAPIDLARERTLLRVRRDLERFVLRLAAERATPAQRAQLREIAGTLRSLDGAADIDSFNQLDHQADALVAAAAAEPFLEHTMRPLHTIFRRIGWIYHSFVRPEEGLGRTVSCHLDMLDAVANARAEAATAAADRLVTFVDSMFDVMDAGIDPALLDCNLALMAAQ